MSSKTTRLGVDAVVALKVDPTTDCGPVSSDFFETKEEAMKREKELKSSRGRAFLRTI